MQIVDDTTKTRGFQAMVAMRDGARLNTFVFLPGSGGPRWPVILHRTPYGITAADAADKTDVTRHGCRAWKNRCVAQSCAAGAISSRMAMPQFIRIPRLRGGGPGVLR